MYLINAAKPRQLYGAKAASNKNNYTLAVNGTLLRGLELHQNLVAVNATFIGETKTSESYRIWSIDDVYPAMLRVQTGGARVSVETYKISAEGIAKVLSQDPPGLSIGKVTLVSGLSCLGVLGEPVLIHERGKEITQHGGWREYLASKKADSSAPASSKAMAPAKRPAKKATVPPPAVREEEAAHHQAQEGVAKR